MKLIDFPLNMDALSSRDGQDGDGTRITFRALVIGQ